YAANTLIIYEYFVSPQLKRGLFLGFDSRSESKIGRPYDWIRTALDHNHVSQQEFYRHCEIVLQPMDTTENWPRIGFESMSSGSVLIVDNRGGWQQMVKHGETGWLCDHERDFIYYASRMAYEPNLRRDMAEAAREYCRQLSSLEESKESWREVLETLNN
ncbi:MAG: glycosyltransferase, partial [Verrucomicrobiota bacterium]